MTKQLAIEKLTGTLESIKKMTGTEMSSQKKSRTVVSIKTIKKLNRLKIQFNMLKLKPRNNFHAWSPR